MSDRRFSGEIEHLRSKERRLRNEMETLIPACLEGLEAKTMLDVGTGSALFAQYFHEQGLRVAGIDINPQMIEAACKLVPQGEFKIAPAEKIPYADRLFDLVFMGCLLHEVDDYVRTLAEAKRVALKRVAVLEFPKIEQSFGPPLEHRLSEEQIREFAARAGLVKMKMIPLTHLVLYLFDI